MLLGIAIWAMIVLALMIGMVSTTEWMQKVSIPSIIFGVMLGSVGAVIFLLHMFRHLDIALDLDEKGARTHGSVAAMQRMVIAAIVLIISLKLPGFFHPLSTFLAFFGVKMSAFMQSGLHKLLHPQEDSREGR